MIEQFAQDLLHTHAHRGTFTVDLPNGGDGDALARAFEGLGCTVEPDPFDMALRVTVPERVAG